MAAPIIAADIAGKLASGIGEAANFPVIGSKKTTIRKTKTRTIITEQSVQLRAWEIGAIGLAGAVVYALVGEDLGLKKKKEGEFDFGNIGLGGVLIPPVGILQGFGLLPQF